MSALRSGLLAVVVAVGSLTDCTTSRCLGECPTGSVSDSTGCACVQSGPVCDADAGTAEVQDGGTILGNCCPRDVLQSTSRGAPTGTCSGSLQCFVAVHQVCPGSDNSSSPLDTWDCTCDGAHWHCSHSLGAGICLPSDASAGGH